MLSGLGPFFAMINGLAALRFCYCDFFANLLMFDYYLKPGAFGDPVGLGLFSLSFYAPLMVLLSGLKGCFYPV